MDEIPSAAAAFVGAEQFAELGAGFGGIVGGVPGAGVGAIFGGIVGGFAGMIGVKYALATPNDPALAALNTANFEYEQHFGPPGQDPNAYDSAGNPLYYSAFGLFARNAGFPATTNSTQVLGPMGTSAGDPRYPNGVAVNPPIATTQESNSSSNYNSPSESIGGPGTLGYDSAAAAAAFMNSVAISRPGSATNFSCRSIHDAPDASNHALPLLDGLWVRRYR